VEITEAAAGKADGHHALKIMKGLSFNIVVRLQDMAKFAPNGILTSERTLRSVMKLRPDSREMDVRDAGKSLGRVKICERPGIAD
jgi:cell fate regulator YaaT (PSP1 superfamily)